VRKVSARRAQPLVWDLSEVGALPEDELDKVVEQIATALVAAGVTEGELDDLQRVADHLAEEARHMQRPS